MRSPQPQQSLRNGVLETSAPHPHHYHSTVSLLKLRRFNTLILIFRFVSFCFCLASTIFMATNSDSSLSWADFTTFRVVVAANGIVAVYSLAEMGASIWEILKGTTVLPETIQVWFDFSHDQVFAYLLVSADVAGTTMVRTLRDDGNTRNANNSFFVQSTISISLGYVGSEYKNTIILRSLDEDLGNGQAPYQTCSGSGSGNAWKGKYDEHSAAAFFERRE